MFGDPAGLVATARDVTDGEEISAKQAAASDAQAVARIDALAAKEAKGGGRPALCVLVKGAKGLASADAFGASDPYCAVRLSP